MNDSIRKKILSASLLVCFNNEVVLSFPFICKGIYWEARLPVNITLFSKAVKSIHCCLKTENGDVFIRDSAPYITLNTELTDGFVYRFVSGLRIGGSCYV